jgi:hypothetical protein
MVLWVLYKIFNSKLAVYTSITVVLFKKMDYDQTNLTHFFNPEWSKKS